MWGQEQYGLVGIEDMDRDSQMSMLEKFRPILLEDPYGNKMMFSRNLRTTIYSSLFYVEGYVPCRKGLAE